MEHTKRNNRIMLLLFTGVLMGALDISMVGPAIPVIEKSLMIHGRELSLIFSIYLLFYLFGIPFMSKLSDVHGRRSIYIISLAIFGLGAGLVSLSHNITLLLIGRAIQGFGSSGVFPVAAATIGDVFPAEKRGRALGLLGAVFGIAFIVGPIIAGTMLHFFNWNSIFLINLPVVVILIAFAMKLLPGKPAVAKPEINWIGIIMLVVLLSSYTIGLNNIDIVNPGASLFSLSVLPFLVLVLLFAPLLVLYERRQKTSFISMEFFRSRQLRLAGFISFGLGLFQSAIVFIPKLEVELFNVTPSKASFMLLPLVLSIALVPPVSGSLLDKIGSRIIVLAGLIFAVVSLFIFSMLPDNIPLFYAAEIAFGVGLAIRASLKYIVLNEALPTDRAVSLGMLIIFITLGQLTGATMIGIIISGSPEGSLGFRYSFIILAVISLLLIMLSFFLKSRKKEILKLNNE